jgi:hypothetical protein
MRDSEKLGRAVSFPQAFQDKKYPPQKGGCTTQSNGNGSNNQPQIKKVYEPLDRDRWVELDTETQGRELAFSEEVRQELEIIEEDQESDSN